MNKHEQITHKILNLFYIENHSLSPFQISNEIIRSAENKITFIIFLFFLVTYFITYIETIKVLEKNMKIIS